MICKSNATRLALDAEVRRRLWFEGVLTGEDVTLNAVTASGRHYRLSLAKGDRLRFGIRCKIGGQAVINGTVRDIAVEDGGHALIVADISGREVLFSSRDVVDESGHVCLATDYASPSGRPRAILATPQPSSRTPPSTEETFTSPSAGQRNNRSSASTRALCRLASEPKPASIALPMRSRSRSSVNISFGRCRSGV